MFFSKNDLKLTHRDIDGVLGSGTPIGGNYAIQGILRAIALNQGETDLSEIKKSCKIVETSKKDEVDLKADIQGGYYNGFAFVFVQYVGSDFTKIEELVIDGWKTFDDPPFLLNKYLSQFQKTKVFTKESEKSIIVVSENVVDRVWQRALISTFGKLLSWYPSLSSDYKDFGVSISVSKNTTREQARESFIYYIDEAYKKVNFREIILRDMLDGYDDRIRKKMLRDLRRRVESIESNISDLSNRLGEEYKQRTAAKLSLEGALLIKEANDNDSMLKFFVGNKCLNVINVGDDFIKYWVDETLEYYDQEEYESMLEDEDSYIHDYESILPYITAIFRDHYGVIRTNAVFRLDDFKLINPISDESYADNSMPNPHIYNHACSGDNSVYYSQYAQSGDWQSAIEQSIAATKNVNMGDSTVFNELIEWLRDNDEINCIYVNEDGSPVKVGTKGQKLICFSEFKKMIDKSGGMN